MGVSRLKRLLSETIATSLDTNYIEEFGNDIFHDFNLHKLCGISDKYTINRKDAADCLVMHAYNLKSGNLLTEAVIKLTKNGYKGQKINLASVKSIYAEIHACGLDYNEQLGKIIQKDTSKTRTDWGMLKEGETASFCFMSIDICGSSILTLDYDREDIKETYRHIKNAVIKSVEKRKGRIWYWEGDGGLIAFHIGDTATDGVLAAIEIYSLLTIINLTQNTLGEPVNVRIALHTGYATYKNPTNAIISESIQYTRDLEKNFTKPMTITLSPNTFGNLDAMLRNSFTKQIENGVEFFRANLPIRSL